jgi:hypothetical protein
MVLVGDVGVKVRFACKIGNLGIILCRKNLACKVYVGLCWPLCFTLRFS